MDPNVGSEQPTLKNMASQWRTLFLQLPIAVLLAAGVFSIENREGNAVALNPNFEPSSALEKRNAANMRNVQNPTTFHELVQVTWSLLQ